MTAAGTIQMLMVSEEFAQRVSSVGVSRCVVRRRTITHLLTQTLLTRFQRASLPPAIPVALTSI